MSLFWDEGELIYWENLANPEFLQKTIVNHHIRDVQCVLSSFKGNVSLVSRLILDAGLTAELVKVWSEQIV